jgi:predicted RNA-binding Zn-ribbon protein involved in translation (DUF1610 family)
MPDEPAQPGGMNQCPNCHSQNIATGRLAHSGHSGPAAIAFVPGKLKWYQFSLEGGAQLSPEAFACPDCGFVWAKVAYTENLRAALSRSRNRNEAISFL